VAQVAGAIGLVCIALLFEQALTAVFLKPRGFNADDVALVELSCRPKQDRALCLKSIDQGRGKLHTLLPGLDTALADDVPVPFSPRPFSMTRNDEERGTVMDDEVRGPVRLAAVDAGYFAVLGTRITAGRCFNQRDDHGTELVAVVSESLARTWFGSAEAGIGNTVRVASLGGARADVVGVAEDVKRSIWDDHELPVIYAHYAQVDPPQVGGTSKFVLLLRLPGGIAARTMASILDELRAGGEAFQVGSIQTVRDGRLQEIAQTTAYLTVATVFACVTLILTALGVFASAASLVARRSPELAIRQAVGASPRRAQGAVLISLVRWWSAAVVLGSALAFGGGRVLGSWQVGVSPVTAIDIGTSLLVVSATMALAAWVPLRRALHVEPSVLMRRE
jgi:hypothetical protein